MIRKKYYTYLIVGCFFWFLIIIKLNSIIYINQTDVYVKQIITEAKIDYFAKQYKKSIEVDENNHNGELGQKVIIPESEKDKQEKMFNLHKFNELASSKIPLVRKIPEKRRASCFQRKYPINLPRATIIIIFHNEAFSTLARTVHTAISRSPDFLINEILLVDDKSDYTQHPHLLHPLEKHFENIPKVKILRAVTRVGLTRARLMGAKSATGDVLVFLDSHCECFDGWLEPLLADIKSNPRSAITPIIEVINMDDFSISPNTLRSVSIGAFTWKADFTWYSPPNQDSSASLIRSPTMAGGLFAIGKDYFYESGSYDSQMSYWGGENIEMSFRLWLCGGGIYTDPCSIVGHVFRKSSPHDLPQNAVLFNKIRAVEVWMDNYKEIVYRKIGLRKYDTRAGSLESRIALRKDLNCKSFEWYLENIATNIRKPGNHTNIKNPETDKCIDSVNNKISGNHINIYTCHKLGGNQVMEVDRKGIIIFDELCMDLAAGYPGAKPTFYSCHFTGGNQKWNFVKIPSSDNDIYLIKHNIFNVCIKIDTKLDSIITDKCNENDTLQFFTFTYSS